MSLFNYKENCRLCLKVDRPNASKNIFSHCLEDCQDSLLQIISSMFNIELHTHESYPQLVCRKCLAELKNFLFFKEDLLRNQEFLLGLFRVAYPNYVEKNDPDFQLTEDSSKPLNNYDTHISEEEKDLAIKNETYSQAPQITNVHCLEDTNKKRTTRSTSKQVAKGVPLQPDENRNLPFESLPKIETEFPIIGAREIKPDVENERISTSMSTNIVTPGTRQVSFLQNFNLITLKDANILKTQQAPLTRAGIRKKYKAPKMISPISVNITKAIRKNIVQKRSRKKNTNTDLFDKRSANFLKRYGSRKFNNTHLRSGKQIKDGKEFLGPNTKFIDKSNNAVSKQKGCENVYKDEVKQEVKLERFSTYEVEDKTNEELQIEETNLCIPKSEVPSPIVNKSSPKNFDPIPSKCFYQPNTSPQGKKICLDVKELKSPSHPKKSTFVTKSKVANKIKPFKSSSVGDVVELDSDQGIWSVNDSQGSISRKNGRKSPNIMLEKVPNKSKLKKVSSFDKSNTSRQPMEIDKIKSENMELVKPTFNNELAKISLSPRKCVATERRKMNLSLNLKPLSELCSDTFEENYFIKNINDRVAETQQPFGAAAVEERKCRLRGKRRSSNKDRLSLDYERTKIKQECIDSDDIVERKEIKQERDLRSSSRLSGHLSNESLFRASTSKKSKSTISPIKSEYSFNASENSISNTPNLTLSPDKTCFNALTTSLQVKTELVSAFHSLSDQYEIDDNIGLRTKLRKTILSENMNSLKFDTQEVDELEGNNEVMKFDVARSLEVDKLVEGPLHKSPLLDRVRNVNVNDNEEFRVTVTECSSDRPVFKLQRQSSGSKRKSRPPVKFSPSGYNSRPTICFYQPNNIQNVTHKMLKLLRPSSQQCLKFDDVKVTRRSPKANGSVDKTEMKTVRKNLKS